MTIKVKNAGNVGNQHTFLSSGSVFSLGTKFRRILNFFSVEAESMPKVSDWLSDVKSQGANGAAPTFSTSFKPVGFSGWRSETQRNHLDDWINLCLVVRSRRVNPVTSHNLTSQRELYEAVHIQIKACFKTELFFMASGQLLEYFARCGGGSKINKCLQKPTRQAVETEVMGADQGRRPPRITCVLKDSETSEELRNLDNGWA